MITCHIKKNRTPDLDEAEDQRRRGNAAQSRIQHGQVSRARHELTGARLAPKTEETLAELQRTRPQEQRRQISPDVLEYRPEVPLSLDKELFINALRSSPSGSALGPGGCTNEMPRVCLDDAHVLDLLYLAAEGFCQGRDTSIQIFRARNHDGIKQERWRNQRHCHGRGRIWPNLFWPSSFGRIWPEPHLANTTFGQS